MKKQWPPNKAEPVSWGPCVGLHDINCRYSNTASSHAVGHTSHLPVARGALWRVNDDTPSTGQYREHTTLPDKTVVNGYLL